VACVGAGLVPARSAAGCGPPGGYKGRPCEPKRLTDLSIWLTHSAGQQRQLSFPHKLRSSRYSPGRQDLIGKCRQDKCHAGFM